VQATTPGSLIIKKLRVHQYINLLLSLLLLLLYTALQERLSKFATKQLLAALDPIENVPIDQLMGRLGRIVTPLPKSHAEFYVCYGGERHQ
jgi:hypothetical protein